MRDRAKLKNTARKARKKSRDRDVKGRKGGVVQTRGGKGRQEKGIFGTERRIF